MFSPSPPGIHISAWHSQWHFIAHRQNGRTHQRHENQKKVCPFPCVFRAKWASFSGRLASMQRSPLKRFFIILVSLGVHTHKSNYSWVMAKWNGSYGRTSTLGREYNFFVNFVNFEWNVGVIGSSILHSLRRLCEAHPLHANRNEYIESISSPRTSAHSRAFCHSHNSNLD